MPGATMAGLAVPEGLGGKLMEMMDRNAGATTVGLAVPDGLGAKLIEMVGRNAGATVVRLEAGSI